MLGIDAEAVFVDVELEANDGLYLDVDQCVNDRRVLCNRCRGLFRCPFPLAYAAIIYGCCCSYCSCSTKVEKEKEVVIT